jgi:ParB-like nuclease domain
MKITINPDYDRQVPKPSQQEYSSLKQDIHEYGQLYPIIVNQDGVVLDGHHRFRICEELGKEPEYKVKEFKDDAEERLFVIKSNLAGKGRHLNKFRRTELALKLKPDLKEIARRNESLGGKNKKKSTRRKGDRNLTPLGRVVDEIARMANVSRDTVTKVEKIIESLEEEDIERLRAEEVSINQAYNQILEQERLWKIYEAIEPFRPQIESIMEEWEVLLKNLFQEFSNQLSEIQEKGPNILAQVKEDIANKFTEYGIREYYMKILSAVFDRLTANKQLDPREEMSKALESIKGSREL